MAINLLNLTPHSVSRDLSGYITFIYGISQNRVEMSVQNMPVSDLNYIYDNGQDVFLVGYGDRFVKFRLAGNTLTITGRGGSNTPVIYRILGHKQAPYNASAPMIKVAAYGRDKNVNTTTTWTALHDGIYLVANFNVNSDGGNKTLASAITSTGNIYDSWNSAGVSGADTRCYNMTWAIVEAAAGDTITLDTQQGEKSVRLTRAGTTTSLLSYKRTGSVWLTFEPGENEIAFDAEEGEGNLRVTLEGIQRFEGV